MPFLITTSIICCIGIPLNGIVIWLLGFQIKRSPFTVLILNLAIADFGYVVFMAVFCIYDLIDSMLKEIPSLILSCLTLIVQINGLCLLAAISIDRCVSVLFPIWHRYSLPKLLSPVVCAFLWICSVLLGGIPNIVHYVFDSYHLIDLSLLLTSVFCLSLITISTLILFFKICLKPKQIKRGRLLVMILITLLCFLTFNLPLNIYGLHSLYFYQDVYLHELVILGASLNSSVNPVIYYLVGRKKRTQTRENIKVIFERVFKEDEAPESTEIPTNTTEIPL